MAIHKDFQLINNRLIAQFGEVKGNNLFSSWVAKKEFDSTKPFPVSNEKKEKSCNIRGLEIKESDGVYHVEGLIATDHIDEYDKNDNINMPDYAPVKTLEAWATQINTTESARVMGVHHSEGRAFNAEYFGIADVENTPAKVVTLTDGHNGLYVDTKLLSNDPKTPQIIKDFQSNKLNSFSITYDVGNDGFDFDVVDDRLVRVLTDKSILYGYTAASNPVNPNAIATGHGFKEFKELVTHTQLNLKEVKKMDKKEVKEEVAEIAAESEETKPVEAPVVEEVAESEAGSEEPSEEDVAELKEFRQFKANKKSLEAKEALEKQAGVIAGKILSKIEIKEKVLRDDNAPATKEVSLEIKEFIEARDNTKNLEIKQQFSRAGALCEAVGLDWQKATNTAAESREYKSFGIVGRNLEYKGLGITTNQNTDVDYLQSSAELQDVYDPIIYNALNQATRTWNILAKDDYSSKGNNQVQFTLKTAANASAAFYSGNSVSTGNVTRLKYQTKFKKLQVGVSVDGDMIAAARGGPVSDVFAQEVMDSTIDMLSVLNSALFAEVGLETADGIIGFEYITDSAGNPSLYNLTRSAANKLAPDSAGDTYINQASTVISMDNLRAAIRQCVTDGSDKVDLVFITSPTQGDMLRGKFDDSRRMLTARDTDFGFSTDLFVDGVPVFEDKDCNSDDWFCVDLSAHRVGMWIPPTIERLGKSADSEDAFIKMYLATYNRAPRRMVQIYGCATS
ncbi:MAG: hypothetical protein DRO67_07435 [Candidatus Asgardarchaeum californiense]|nr:MAG: hypothetical protein DRO67_07435 [Candidatus Asgardarchaeum californiense]